MEAAQRLRTPLNNGRPDAKGQGHGEYLPGIAKGQEHGEVPGIVEARAMMKYVPVVAKG